MQFKSETAPLWQTESDAVIVGVFLNESCEEALKPFSLAGEPDSQKLLNSLALCAKDDAFIGKVGQFLSWPTYGQAPPKRIILAGLGKAEEFDADVMRKMSANMARRLTANQNINRVCFALRQASEGNDSKKSVLGSKKLVKAVVEGWILGSFSFLKYKTVKEDKRAEIREIAILGWVGDEKEFADVCRTGQTIAESVNFARTLIAEPACFMTPTRLAEEAQTMSKKHGLSCKVIEASEAEKLGMGSFLGVARGAKEPCKFVVLRYAAKDSPKTIGLIGKGITFDSGGLSLKPAVSMEHMKYDMSGAAAVLATMRVVGILKPNVSVLGVIAATENMPGDNALHPGDVLKSMNGKTIEVNNTDAEGRLVLADALTYAQKEGADELIDIATLTGAIVTALGRCCAGVMGTDQPMLDRLISAAKESGERLWQMPLFDEYKEYLKSDVADLKNAGSRGEAGSSSAAMFLKEFIEGKPWAHLDIAGPGWLDKDRDDLNKGGTAFGVRTMCQYILEHGLV